MTIVTPADLPLRDRSLIVVLVVLAHALLLWSLVSLPDFSRIAHHEMSVSIAAMPIPTQAVAAEPQPKLEPVVKPKTVEPRVQPVAEAVTPAAPEEQPASPPLTNAAPAQPVNVPSGLPDSEPDYQAAYLNNPVPVYPMVARRMGWQGKVVLNVEVLASGSPGQIKLQQSSGHEVLDNAAMQAVRDWRFVAARQSGQAVSRWFLVPIPFILKED
ncbi:MAG: energy transducer TonB [Gallionella sp.]|nr:energy transducer TonB [Gallionella sp.]